VGQPLKCPGCKAEQKRLKPTGQARGTYDDMVELRCGACQKVWFSVSPIALEMLRKVRE